MALLVVCGIWSMQTTNNKIEYITKTNNAKLQLAHSVRNAIDAIDKGSSCDRVDEGRGE